MDQEIKKKKIGKIFLVAIFFVLILSLSIFLLVEKNRKELKEQQELVSQVEINGKIFKVESAKNPEKQNRGLGYRDSLCEDCGMIFIFPQKSQYGFWMKGMRFSLDIIWISDGEIVYVAKNIPPDHVGTIFPPSPTDKVLEINAGLSDKYQIKEGDQVVFKNIF